MDTISVIIPVYNTEKYVKKCIQSVCAQSFSNIEIIVINDGSTDTSKAICEGFLDDERVKLINQKNQGQGKARNVGIETASGQYLLFLDSDDYLEKDCVEILYNGIINSNSDISIVDYYDISEDGKQLKKATRRKSDITVFSAESAVEDMLYHKTFGVGPWAKLFKKKLWDDIRFPENIIYEDLATTYRVVAKAERIVFLPFKKMFYLHREGSDVHQPFNKRKESIIDSSQKIKEFVLEEMPSIYNSAISREFTSAFSLYLQVDDDYVNRDIFKAIILNDRKTVLFDNKATKKVRIAALLSFVSMKLCEYIFGFCKKLNANF